MYFIVLWISYVFLLFLRLMYFIVFLYGIVWVLNITKYNSDFNCNESKYCILELKMEFWHKKPFSIRFVHKSRKLSNFEPTFDYIMLRNLRTVRPIFPKVAPKVAQDFKEKKSWKLAAREKISAKLSHETSRGGADSPPPPPGLLGLKVIWSVGKGSEIFPENSHLFDFHLKAYYVCIVVTWKLFPWNVLIVFVEFQVKTKS